MLAAMKQVEDKAHEFMRRYDAEGPNGKALAAFSRVTKRFRALSRKRNIALADVWEANDMMDTALKFLAQ